MRKCGRKPRNWNSKGRQTDKGEQEKYCSDRPIRLVVAPALRFPSRHKVFTHIRSCCSHETRVFCKSCQFGVLQETQNMANKSSCLSAEMPVTTLRQPQTKQCSCKFSVEVYSWPYKQEFDKNWFLCNTHNKMLLKRLACEPWAKISHHMRYIISTFYAIKIT